jgi:ribosomal protein L28
MPGILPEPRRRAQNRFTPNAKAQAHATPVCGERKKLKVCANLVDTLFMVKLFAGVFR